MSETRNAEKSDVESEASDEPDAPEAAYLEINSEGRVVMESPEAATLIGGVDNRSLLGESLFALFRTVPVFLRSYKPPEHYCEFETNIETAAGSSTKFRVGIFPARLRAQTDAINLVVITKLSPPQKSQADFHQASSHYWGLFDASSDAILLENAEGEIIDCNRSCETMYGYSRSELLRMNARDLVPGNVLDTIENLAPELEHTRAGGSGIQLEAVGRRKDGSMFPSEVLINYLKIGEEECFAVTVRDITHRKEIERSRVRYESQILQLQKLDHLGQMANGLAKDFNNLLTGIMGYADLLLRELPGASAAREKARRIVDAARKAGEIIQQLMAYSGKMPTLYQKTSIRNLFREMQPDLCEIVGNGHEFSLKVDQSLPDISIDSVMLKQALINILKNSIESVDAGTPGKIFISVFPGLCSYSGTEKGYFGPPVKAGQYVAIKVSDNGCGIPSENLYRIFDPFFTTRYAQRGLGLSSVIGMLRRHRGAVMVTSSVGCGTDFTVFLPVDLFEASSVGPQDVVSADNCYGRCALIIDDDAHVREILADNIKMLGYEVYAAENGNDGLEMFKTLQRKLSLVLADLFIPEMNGLELIGVIRWMNPEIPVVVCTGATSEDKILQLEKLGVSAVLEKPFSIKELETHLTRIQLKFNNRCLNAGL